MTEPAWPLRPDVWERIKAIESAITQAECGELVRQAQRSEAAIVEVGCYHGRSTACLAVGAIIGAKAWTCVRPDVEPPHRTEPCQPVFAVDPADPWTDWWGSAHGSRDRFTFMLSMMNLGLFEVVRPVCIRSTEAAAAFLARGEPLGMVFIDGDHAVSPTMEDFAAWSPLVQRGGAVLLHDTTLRNKEGLLQGPGHLLRLMFGDPEQNPDTIVAGGTDWTGAWHLEKRVDSLAVLRRL